MSHNPTVNLTNCLCIVVSFNPDKALHGRLKKLIELFQFVLVVDNSYKPEHYKNLTTYTTGLGLTIIRNTENLGLGKALNQGFEYASSHGFDWCVFFDQDTEIYPSFLTSLQQCLDSLDSQPSIIGSNYIDAHAQKPRFKAQPEGAKIYREVKTVITSGSLISTQLYNEIGGFREDYFIDSIDHEYCLRARKYNHKIILNTLVTMQHSLGEKRVKKGVLMSIPEHGAMRKYYIARNMAITVKAYKAHEKIWCLKQILRLVSESLCIIFFESNKIEKLAATLKGLRHGLTGRLDAYT